MIMSVFILRFFKSASHINTLADLFGSIYMFFLNLHSGVYSPNSCRYYELRVLSSTIQYHLMPGSQFNHLVGVKCMARDRKYKLFSLHILPTFCAFFLRCPFLLANRLPLLLCMGSSWGRMLFLWLISMCIHCCIRLPIAGIRLIECRLSLSGPIEGSRLEKLDEEVISEVGMREF